MNVVPEQSLGANSVKHGTWNGMERGMECGMEHGMERGIEWHVICYVYVHIIASFPGLHAQLLSLPRPAFVACMQYVLQATKAGRGSDKSWAWRPGNEAIICTYT